MPDLASRVVSAIIDESETHIQETGQCPRPQVHILAEDMSEPKQYIGYAISRRFYQGADAAAAIANLGRLPAALAATRLFVVWEETDLRKALEMSNPRPAQGLSIVDVRADGNTMLWLPFDAAKLGSRIVVNWGSPARYENVKLHSPIEDLIKVWRGPPDDLERTVLGLQEAGYQIKWSIAFKS
ncbi:hypothetical protein [Micromonospora rubida]